MSCGEEETGRPALDKLEKERKHLSLCPLGFSVREAKTRPTGLVISVPLPPNGLDSPRPKHTSENQPFGLDVSKTADLVDDMNTTIVYYLKNERNEPCCVFKPCLRPGSAVKISNKRFCSKEEVLSEICAYEMDKGMFNIVPKTVPLSFHLKTSQGETKLYGSAQEFVPEADSCADYGYQKFNILDVQKIAILDIRILNLDRHDGNMLLKGGSLVPIDHALAFSNKENLSNINFEWVSFPQVKQPVEKEILEKLKVLRLKNKEYVKVMERYKLSREQICLALCSSTLLCTGILDEGKTLYEIGKMILRDYKNIGQPSVFEQLVEDISFQQDWNTVIRKFSERLRDYFNDSSVTY